MALVDYNNKVIYWDEVNWHWLPHVKVDKSGCCYFVKEGKASPIKCKEDAIKLLDGLNYRLSPIHVLGVSEISCNLFLYNEKLYEVSNLKPSIATLISNITGKSKTWVARKIIGKGVLSESIFDELVFQNLKVEYNGKFYSGYPSLAKDLGIHYSAIYKGLSKGLTIDEIVKNHKPRSVKDHLGTQFDTTKDMLERWGIPRDSYNRRLSKGWSLEEALTIPLMNVNGYKRCKDHLGNEYASKGDMLKNYGVKPITFTKRIGRGWTLEEALTGKRRGR